MLILETIKETTSRINKVKNKNHSVGFVPTMGSLHEGHLYLIREAKKNNDFVACSIFVNPIQFNNKTDLQKYPRDIDRDIALLQTAGCDLLFYPSENEMYPEPASEVFDFGNLDKVMEGKFRPGHFNGVAIVVKKLLEITIPDKAYFGLKDFQQLVIIQTMVDQLKLPVEIIPCPTMRESDGLAMSSRNQLLNPSDRKKAPMIFEALKQVKDRINNSTIQELKNYIEELFLETENTKLEYFEIVDMKTLEPAITVSKNNQLIACIAVYFGNVRLIDNIILIS
jgi:pantoate--beta-alanine ligase